VKRPIARMRKAERTLIGSTIRGKCRRGITTPAPQIAPAPTWISVWRSPCE
jgi:hypothetical protein